jgi:hypothetical protein
MLKFILETFIVESLTTLDFLYYKIKYRGLFFKIDDVYYPFSKRRPE